MRFLRVTFRAILCLVGVGFVADSVRVAIALTRDDGVRAALTDPLFWHQTGSILIIASWFGVVLRRRTRLSQLGALSVVLGAALCAYGGWALRERTNWAPFGWGLAGFALVSPWTVRRPWSRRTATAALILGWCVAAASGFLDSGYRWYPIRGSLERTATDRDGRWREDLEFLRRELIRLHCNPFHTVSEEHWNQRCDELHSAIPKQSDLEIAAGFAKLVAAIGDAHTSLVGDYYSATPRLPLEVRWMADGLVLTHVPANTERVEELLGAVVTHLAGVPAQELLDRVSELIPHENRSWLLRSSPRLFVRPELLAAIGLLPDPATVELTLVKDGSPRVWSVEAVDAATPLSLRTAHVTGGLADSQPEQSFWYERLEDETSVLYVRYRRCRDFWGFRRFASDVLAELERDPPERVVLDLRGNTGGSSLQYSMFLLPGLVDSPWDHPERLFLLIDRGTFSSGSGNAIETAAKTRATLVGEPTGGALNVYGEVRLFRLPHSGYRVTYSTSFHRRRPGSDANTLAPDIVLLPSSQDWLASRDPVLESVRNGW